MKRMLVWIYILWKRLFKKKGFIITLMLIPVLSFLLSTASGDKGFLNIAVAFEGEADTAAKQTVEKLEKENGILRFVISDSSEEAISMAEGGKADAAWVFEGNLKESTQGDDPCLARIYQREENIFLKLTREKLFCTLFPHYSYNIYRQFTAELLPESDISEEEFREAYDYYITDDSLVEMITTDGKVQDIPDYLITPLRGLSVILMLMCGLASTMYYLTDESEGRFCLLNKKGRFGVLLASNLTALTTAAVFVTLSLVLSGNYNNVLTETSAMIMLVITGTLFCSLLGALISNLKYFALLLPALLTVSLVLCPIFISAIDIPIIQYTLPIYHYMYAVSDMSRLIGMLIYALAALPLAYLFYKITRKQTA